MKLWVCTLLHKEVGIVDQFLYRTDEESPTRIVSDMNVFDQRQGEDKIDWESDDYEIIWREVDEITK